MEGTGYYFSTKRIVDTSVAVLVLMFFFLGILIDVIHNPMKRSFRYRFTRTLNWIVMGWAKAFQTMVNFFIFLHVALLGKVNYFLLSYQFLRYTFYSLSTKDGSSFLNLTTSQYAIVTGLGLWSMPISLLVYN